MVSETERRSSRDAGESIAPIYELHVMISEAKLPTTTVVLLGSFINIVMKKVFAHKTRFVSSYLALFGKVSIDLIKCTGKIGRVINLYLKIIFTPKCFLIMGAQKVFFLHCMFSSLKCNSTQQTMQLTCRIAIGSVGCYLCHF